MPRPDLPPRDSPAARRWGVGSITPLAGIWFLVWTVSALTVYGCGGASSPTRHTARTVRLAVLSEPPSRSDAMPSWVSKAMRTKGDSPVPTVDQEKARWVLRPHSAWLLPLAGGVTCLVRIVPPLVSTFHGRPLGPTASQNCLPDRLVAAGRLCESQSLSTTFRRHLRTLVDGIVPDDVAYVTLHSSDGRSKNVSVERNSYETTAVNPYSVTFVVGEGESRRRYKVPIASAADAGRQPYVSQRR
jgi:hypothetical protein